MQKMQNICIDIEKLLPVESDMWDNKPLICVVLIMEHYNV